MRYRKIRKNPFRKDVRSIMIDHVRIEAVMKKLKRSFTMRTVFLAVATVALLTSTAIFMPMPISWRRQWQRGYNQSVEIARGISKVTGLPIVNKVVRRQHFRQSQTNLNAMERKQNVEGAFLLTHGERIAHRHVLLVDDIVTTGATVTACAQELAKVPGVKISILTLGITKT